MGKIDNREFRDWKIDLRKLFRMQYREIKIWKIQMRD